MLPSSLKLELPVCSNCNILTKTTELGFGRVFGWFHYN
jgi:hypothetical protein